MKTGARRIALRVAIAIAAAAVAWMVALWVAGGFDTIVLGIRLRSNDPSKPRLLAELAVAAIILLRGLPRTRQDLDTVTAWIQFLRQRYLTDIVIVGALATAVFITGMVRMAPVAGGSDSYGYLSQVDLWLSGHPFVEQPWVEKVPWPDANCTFTPLGYRPVESRNAIVPTYAPGLALLMAAIKLVAGYRAMFVIGPLSAAVLVMATYGIGRRLGSSTMGLTAAWLVATSPVVIFQMLTPMTDVPPAAGWALAFYLLFGRSVKTTIGAGLAAGIAALIRPNLVPAAAVMGLWLVYKVWQDAADRPRHIRRVFGFALGLVPGIGTIAGVFWWLYGSPLRSGYATLDVLFSASHISSNGPRYLSWLGQSQTPAAWLGLLALALPLRWIWRQTEDRSMIVALALLTLALWGEFAAFELLYSWDYLRYVVASWPAIMLGMAAVALLVARSGGRLTAVATFVAIVGIGVWTVRYADSKGAFYVQHGEYKYPSVAQLVRDRTDEATVVMGDLHTGSLRYYGGRMTMAESCLGEVWLDRTVDWLTEHGIHTYALFEKEEVPRFTERFAGQQHARLGGRLVFVYHGASTVYFYDLSRPLDQPLTPQVIVEDYSGPQYVLPVPPPTLVFKE